MWSWTLTALGVLYLWIAGTHPRLGWAVAFLTQPLWLVYAASTQQWGFAAAAVLYAIVFARNWRRASPPNPTNRA